MKFINKMRKKEKGFTLVEIIVVLVILAILAAFTIPTMLGFVGQAREKAAIAEQREVYVAAQAVATEYFAKKDTTLTNASLSSSDVGDTAKTAAPTKSMKTYLGTDIVAGDGSGANPYWTVEVTSGKVTKVTYKKNGLQIPDLTPNSTIS